MDESDPQPHNGKRHSFSIELSSIKQLTGFNLLHNRDKSVLIEGSLGELMQISLIELVMLEVKCSQGILRIDLTENEYRRAINLVKEMEPK